MKHTGAGVAVYVLADVDEEAPFELGESVVGVFGIEVGPGSEHIVVWVECHGLCAGY